MGKIKNKKIECRIVISWIILVLNAIINAYIIVNALEKKEYNIMLISMIAIWCISIVICLIKPKERFCLLIFYLMLALFLVSRITIHFFRGIDWWEYSSIENNMFFICVMSTAMIALLVGALLVEVLSPRMPLKKQRTKKKTSLLHKQEFVYVVRVALFVCFACFFLHELDKLMFMRGRAYEEYFSLYQSRLPRIINLASECMPYLLCMFLALKPSKKESIFWLVLYIVSAFPMLKIGVRNIFILNCLFSAVYFFIREITKKESEKHWIGKKELIIAVCAIPVLVLSMGALNYIRDGKSVSMSPGNLVVDFVYKQGTTYDTVMQGYQYRKELPWDGKPIYSFGAVTDSLYTSIGKKLFHLEDIGNGNSLKAVYNGHSFAHVISYLVMGKNYISGEGRGSSYIIENYIDWGYLGVVIFNVILGGFLAFIPKGFKKNWLANVILLSIVSRIFFIPRESALYFATFLVSYKFWACIIGVIILTWLLLKAEHRYPNIERVFRRKYEK